ncbi:MAG: hypothetical protein QM709_14815 [Spongiibacteraceae bacterium]
MTTAPESVLPDPEVAATDSAPQPTPSNQEPAPTLLDAIEEWLVSLRVAIARAVDITVLEARLAALNFALIIIVAVGSGLLLATSWIALFAAVVAWFHELGLSWSAALLLMAAINLALAAAGGYAIYRMSNNMLFKAIRKFITYAKSDSDGRNNSNDRNNSHDANDSRYTNDEITETPGEDHASRSATGNTPPAP